LITFTIPLSCLLPLLKIVGYSAIIAVHYYQLRIDIDDQTVDAHLAGTPEGFNAEKEISVIAVIVDNRRPCIKGRYAARAVGRPTPSVKYDRNGVPLIDHGIP
jgi:hypothetical protein